MFPKFYFSRKCGFRCFRATDNRYDKDLIKLRVEKCEVILYCIFEESVVHYLK